MNIIIATVAALAFPWPIPAKPEYPTEELIAYMQRSKDDGKNYPRRSAQ